MGTVIIITTTAPSYGFTSNTAITNKSSGNNFLRYLNPSFGINVQYPSNWAIVKRNSTDNSALVLVFVSRPSNLLNENEERILGNIPMVAVIATKYATLNPPTADEEFTKEVTNLKNNINVYPNNIKSSRTTLLGYPAYAIEYTTVPSNIKTTELYILKDGKTYILLYIAKANLFASEEETALKI